jgi:hypothetical protein
MLLHAPLGAVAEEGWPTDLLAALPYARRLALERRPTAARYASLAGLALALCACERLAGAAAVPALRTLVIDPRGKPSFPEAASFSLSHCDGHVACVAVEAVTVGLDLEAVPDESRYEEVARWTAIEAVLKAAASDLRAARDVELAVDGSVGRLAGATFLLQAVPGLGDNRVAHVASRVPLAIEVVPVSLWSDGIAATVERSLRLPA